MQGCQALLADLARVTGQLTLLIPQGSLQLLQVEQQHAVAGVVFLGVLFVISGRLQLHPIYHAFDLFEVDLCLFVKLLRQLLLLKLLLFYFLTLPLSLFFNKLFVILGVSI